METAIDELSNNITLGDFRKVSVILNGFIEHWSDFIRFIRASENHVIQQIIRKLDSVIRLGKYGKNPDIAMEILVRLARTEHEAFSVVLPYLSLKDRKDDLLCYLAVDHMEDHFSWKEVEAIPSETLRSLIKHESPAVISRALNLLSKVAPEAPQQAKEKVPIELLFEVFSDKEMREADRKEILEIANIFNPVDQATGYIDLDTLFLINWIRKKDNISSTEMDELFDSIQQKYLSGPHVYAHIFALMVGCRDPDILSMNVGESERERDHEIHQFDVGVLGLFLLEINVSSSKTLKEYISDLLGWEPDKVAKAWLVACFLHDHARPIVKMFKQALPTYGKMKRHGPRVVEESLENFRRIKRICSKDINEILDRLLKGELHANEDLHALISDEFKRAGLHKKVEWNDIHNHGAMAAVNLATTLPNLLRTRRWDEIRDGEVVKASVRAIAVHDIDSEKVSLEADPIAFLLVLCDVIQEWGREMTLGNISVRIGHFNREGEKLFFPDNFKAIFEYPSAQKSRGIGFKDEKFLEGLESAEKRFDLSNLGIKPKKIRLRPQLSA